MRFRRRLLPALGLLAAAGAAAWFAHRAYYCSNAYRLGVERRLGEFFGLPVEVARIEPRGLSSRRLFEVTLWLPGRREPIFRCPKADWNQTRGTTVLVLDRPTMTIGSPRWQREDYRRVLRAGLGHDFAGLGIHRVDLRDAEVAWPREAFSIRAGGVDGTIRFDDRGDGRAELAARSLNGVRTDGPIRIVADIRPQEEEDLIPQVALDVPRLPLAALGLDGLVQSEVRQGWFEGRITVRQQPGPDTIELSGRADGVRLEEWTARAPGGPVPARLDLEVRQAEFHGGRLAGITFTGKVAGLEVDALLRRFGWPAAGGRLDLEVFGAGLTSDGIEELRASGRWSGARCQALTEAWPALRGVEGDLTVRLNNLIVRGNRVARGDLDCDVRPAPGRGGTLDREALRRLLRTHLGVDLPERMLPRALEYTCLSARVLIEGESLRILSGTGPAGPALITLRLLGRDIPLLPCVDHRLPVEPLVAGLRAQADRLREQLRGLRSRPAD